MLRIVKGSVTKQSNLTPLGSWVLYDFVMTAIFYSGFVCFNFVLFQAEQSCTYQS